MYSWEEPLCLKLEMCELCQTGVDKMTIAYPNGIVEVVDTGMKELYNKCPYRIRTEELVCRKE